ncbi:hypothetical protein C0995_003098 [Termitomyces sp. Mi166|nr:hypothetical protein C0995_003098 [Termitomyces sp. Mi166\
MGTEKTGAKHAFKYKETVDSNSDEEEEEEQVHVIKKIKCEHMEEPIRKGTVAVAGPLCLAPVRVTSGECGSVTQLAEGNPNRGKSKENKSEDSLCQKQCFGGL